MNNKGFTSVEAAIVLVCLVAIPACAYGWIHNLVTLYHSTFTPITGQLVLRVVGVFIVPMGVVMGYL